MELIKLITSVNDFLEQSTLFIGFKFIIGVIVVVLILDILILLYMLIIKDKYYLAFSLGRGFPDVTNTMNRRWSRVMRLIKSGVTERQKEAIVEAGDMLYEILDELKYEGNTLDEKLDKMVGPQLANIEALKKASKIKNAIVNNQNYKLTNEVALNTVREFGEALAEQEAILMSEELRIKNII